MSSSTPSLTQVPNRKEPLERGRQAGVLRVRTQILPDRQAVPRTLEQLLGPLQDQVTTCVTQRLLVRQRGLHPGELRPEGRQEVGPDREASTRAQDRTHGQEPIQVPADALLQTLPRQASGDRGRHSHLHPGEGRRGGQQLGGVLQAAGACEARGVRERQPDCAAAGLQYVFKYLVHAPGRL